MNESANTSPLTIRVYIYTATNGYSWQGCDDALVESLRSCLGSSWKNAGTDGARPLGGIRRGAVGGLNGTVFFRSHVRKSGDFAGRDSDYIALAFIPFAMIREQVVDYAGLWRHPLLAAPLGKDENLAGLEIDLKAAGLLLDHAPMDGSESGKFWTADATPLNDFIGDEKGILAQLGAAFQSRQSELGSFVAVIHGAGDNRVSLKTRYKPFPAVAKEVDAHEHYNELRRASGNETERANAFKVWGNAIEELLSMTDSRNGQFRHFLGLRQFATAEAEALKAGGGQEELKSLQRGLKGAEGVLNALDKHLTGDDNGILDALAELASELKPLADQVGEDGAALRKRLETLNRRLDEARGESQAVARWVEGQLKETEEARDSGRKPDNASAVLSSLAEDLRESRRSRRELAAKCEETDAAIATVKAANQNLENDVLRLEKEKEDLRKQLSDTSTATPSGAGQTPGRPRSRFGVLFIAFLGALLGVMIIAVAILAAFFGRQFLDGGKEKATPTEAVDTAPEQQPEIQESPAKGNDGPKEEVAVEQAAETDKGKEGK